MAKKQVNPLSKLYGMNGIAGVAKALEKESGYRKELIESFLLLDARKIVKNNGEKVSIEELIQRNTEKVDSYEEDYAAAFIDLIIEARKK